MPDVSEFSSQVPGVNADELDDLLLGHDPQQGDGHDGQGAQVADDDFLPLSRSHSKE
jgi:hypothetical protein